MLEWQRVTGAKIANADQLDNSTPLTFQLTETPQREAIKTILRGVNGFVVGLREDNVTVDRIVIMATSAPIQTDVRAPSFIDTAAQTSIHETSIPETFDAVAASTGTSPDVTTFTGAGIEPKRAQDAQTAGPVSSSSQIDPAILVDGANPATLVPRSQRLPTPLAQPKTPAPGSATPGVITSGPTAGIYVPPITERKDSSPQPR